MKLRYVALWLVAVLAAIISSPHKSVATSSVYKQYSTGSFYEKLIFKDCSMVSSMNAADCKQKQYFIKYMVFRLEHSSDAILRTRNLKHIPDEIQVSRTYFAYDHRTREELFSREAPIFEACLKAECAAVLASNPNMELSIADYWHEVTKLFSCIDSKPDISKVKNGWQRIFDQAMEGNFGPCVTNSTSRDVLYYLRWRFTRTATQQTY